MSAVLGIDVGTTGVKVILLGPEGSVLDEASSEHDLSSPKAGWAEEDPHAWWRGVTSATRQIMQRHDPAEIEAVGVSGMVPALILLDEQDHPIRPSIQQNDARATREISYFQEHYDEAELFQQSGATWNQQVIAPKLRWLQDNEPDAWRRMRRLTGSYEYIAMRLTGQAYVEANWALESGMWSAINGEWIDDLLDLAGIHRGHLAEVRRPEEVIGQVTSAAASSTGLAEGTKVIAGSADHIAAALAAGLTRPGEAVLKFGGAGDFLYVVHEFTPIKELFIDYHDLPGRFVLNGCMATSGSLIKWFRDRFRPDTNYAALDAEAAFLAPGSDGIIVLPYFLGEKTPVHDPFARGTIIGLTLTDTPAHLYRALLEGVSYAFKHHVDVLEAAGHTIDRYYVMDGGARSSLWREITASVLGREVNFIEGSHAGSAYGVAYIAGVAAQLWEWDAIRTWIRTATTTEPDSAATVRYRDLYSVYRETYRRLKDLYPRLEVGGE